MTYPRMIAQWPGVLRVVNSKEEHEAVKHAELRVALIIFWAAAAALLLPLGILFWGT